MQTVQAVFLRPLAAAVLVAMAGVAHAAPTTVSTGNVDITYDRDTFVFNRDSGFGTESIDQASVPLSFTGNSVTLDFAGALSVFGSSYGFSSPSAFGSYFANFDFAVQAGYVITGYSVRYTGGYTIETPGDVSLSGTGVGLFESTGGGTFDIVSGIAGPQLSGDLSANGYITSVEVITGYEDVIVGYEDVEICDDFGCTIEQRPIFETVPIIEYQTDLGEASLWVNTITVTANVAAVPEPQTYALLLAGLGVMGLVARRQRR
ncbi:MAG: PEP-CTERM sorting domain-containing protein [Aquabacterium sp.]|nr:PEP-CTERM sorting domain-containing protein [Dechloromonas sp.]MCH2241181.1 PEP-CTERM sorting domain-containing protein [Aquabacterium sp.]